MSSSIFKDPLCLTRNTRAMLKKTSKMHEEDAHDNNLIAMETSNQVHTCAQLRATENNANSNILGTDDLNNNANSPLHVCIDTSALPAAKEAREHATRLPSILQPHANSGDDLAAARPSVERDEASIYMQTFSITANSRSQKHLHVILSRLACQNIMPQTTWYQRARCASLESRLEKSHQRKLS